MKTEKQEKVFYACPNNCPDAYFIQNGTTETVRMISENGEEIESDYYDFTPTGPVMCRKCDTQAVKKKKITVITEVIE